MTAGVYVLHAKDEGRARVLTNLHSFLDRLPADRAFEVTVKRHTKKRTPKQRAALFAAAYGPIMDHMGLQGDDDKKQLHAYWCGEFWGWHPVLRNRPIRTTTRDERGERDEISTIVALEFYAFIQRRAAEEGIDVPDPDPFWKENALKEAA